MVASPIYLVRGTSLLFADAAQAEDVTLTLSALGSGAGIASALYDMGAGSKPGLFSAQLHWALTGTNIVGAAVEVYCFPSVDGTNLAGGITAGAAFATDKRNNAGLVGLALVDQTTTNVVMWSLPLTFFVPTRYFCMGIWDATTLPFQTSTSAHGLILTPLAWEAQ